MKIAVIGPGAMGLLFGSYLSQHHDVTLVGTNPAKIAVHYRKALLSARRTAASASTAPMLPPTPPASPLSTWSSCRSRPAPPRPR